MNYYIPLAEAFYTQGYREQKGRGKLLQRPKAQFLRLSADQEKNVLFQARVSLTLLDFSLCLSIRVKLITPVCHLVILNTLSGLKRQGHL